MQISACTIILSILIGTLMMMVFRAVVMPMIRNRLPKFSGLFAAMAVAVLFLGYFAISKGDNMLAETEIVPCGEGDIEKAVEKLRMDGMAKADKKGSRVAAEGVIGSAIADDAVALVEVNSETDFVSKGDDFKAFADEVAALALAKLAGKSRVTYRASAMM